MEREIKFRAKDKRSGEWCIGELHLASKVPHIHSDVLSSIPINPDTIGQFTGLKDKNGKDIYEEDIVEWLFFYTIYSSNGAGGDREELLKGVIEWRQGGFVFRVLENDFENAGWYSISDLHTETQTDVEVIGNIYDNPELLKGDDI
jgi:uncharacterized phage protein (TIGR01671 family)